MCVIRLKDLLPSNKPIDIITLSFFINNSNVKKNPKPHFLNLKFWIEPLCMKFKLDIAHFPLALLLCLSILLAQGKTSTSTNVPFMH